jgi:hypothetical protein
MAHPCHSIGFCPVCGDGLCGIRIFTRHAQDPYGLVVCDECDAVWTSPDLSGKPIFPDPEDARSPIDGQPLWGPDSHWADLHECARLGWFSQINPALSRHGIPPVDDDPLAPISTCESSTCETLIERSGAGSSAAVPGPSGQRLNNDEAAS